MKVLETERMNLRWLSLDDGDFLVELMNDPSWLQNIGDRGIRSVEDAQAYVVNGPRAMYAQHGFGLYLAELKDSGIPVGMCGLIKRATLADVDIGYAFLPQYWGKGYAYEAASAVLKYGKEVLGLKRIVAITVPENQRSAKLLEKLGFQFEGLVRLAGDTQDVSFFATDF